MSCVDEVWLAKVIVVLVLAQADEISSSWQQSSVADLISAFICFFLTCPVCLLL